MDVVALFNQFGPAWLLVGVLLSIVVYLFKKVINVLESNTSAISKFSEIVSHCERRKS